MIIIKTPQPDTEERLVLVPEGVPPRDGRPAYRDATPDDLARGGYVPSVGYLPRREVETAVSDAMDLQRRLDRMTEVAEQNLERFEKAETELSADTIRADAWKAKAIKAEADLGVAESANEEAGELLAAETARAEKAEGLLIQRETELRLAREDGAAVERQMREARSAADASFVRANRAEMRAEKAERERDEALGRAQSETEWRVRAVSERQDAEVERDTLRAELARLTAPGEGSDGEPGFEHLRDCWDMAPRADASGSDVFRNGFFALYRLGVAHERARQQPRDRATDEELVAIAETAYEAAGRGRGGCVEAAALAVAARVRQERCLVAQAVAANVDIRVAEDVGGGFMVGAHAPGRDEELERAVPASDVPSTLARLLGEVARG